MSAISDNITAIKRRIARAAQDHHISPDSVHLVAVSKQQPDDRIDAALEAGQRLFGENRVQEAEQRWMGRRQDYPDLALHLIGPLQTNKVRDAVALFDVIETIDRIKLADAVLEEMQRQNRIVQCFIQVNTGDESQKGGVSIADFKGLLNHCRSAGLVIDGLMAIPPVDAPPALHFALLRKLAQDNGLKHLSMGMSGDFEKAVALGASFVRIGTAIFGDRQSS